MAPGKQDNLNADVDLGISLNTTNEAGDSPDILLDPEVHLQIEKFAATDTSRELGGVLLGELITDGARPLVKIHAAIEAKHTEAVHTSVKFTHATWDDINQVKDEKYPDLRIVGWFHTHPGFGIFLSRWDMFIQENFFNLPWQVAYVVDPVSKTEGFFRWEQGKVVPVGVEKPEPLPAIDVELPVLEPVLEKRRPGWGTWAATLAIFGLSGALAYTLFFMPPKVRVVTKVVEKKVPVKVSAPASVTTPAQTPIQTPAPAVQREISRSYVVQRGDSLWSIAEREYGDGAYVTALCIYNYMGRNDRLNVGATLEIPCREVADRLCRIHTEAR